MSDERPASDSLDDLEDAREAANRFGIVRLQFGPRENSIRSASISETPSIRPSGDRASARRINPFNPGRPLGDSSADSDGASMNVFTGSLVNPLTDPGASTSNLGAHPSGARPKDKKEAPPPPYRGVVTPTKGDQRAPAGEDTSLWYARETYHMAVVLSQDVADLRRQVEYSDWGRQADRRIFTSMQDSRRPLRERIGCSVSCFHISYGISIF